MPPNTDCSEDAIQAAVRALRSGADPAASELIYRCFYPSLFRFFANQRFLREEADDLAQTTLIRAFQNIDHYRSEGTFEAWLLRIAANLWKNAVRDRLAAKRGPLLDAGELPSDDRKTRSPSALSAALTDPTPNPEQLALAEEQTQVLRRAIETLPSGMRTCTELRVFSHLEDREIAQVAGIGLSSVRSQLFEARKRLKPVLERYFRDAEF